MPSGIGSGSGRSEAKGRGGHDKAMVHGVLERGGEIRAKVVRKGRERVAYAADHIREAVTPGSHVYTDIAAEYQRLGEDFLHEIVNHAIEYVRGRVHCNGMENFWSLLKRALRGTYVAVDPDHLEAYVDEQVFRFNNREATDWQRFDRLMGMVVGKRLTYSDLTGGKIR
ncbi:MAG: IS1595 family transposase [Planctomycetes bacterium]|nr:IS1595 family transposase [Planctomycetota bacterium]